MNKRELALLEKAFDREVSDALSGGLGIMQTKSKLAHKLVEDGLLELAIAELGGRFPVIVRGFTLTHLGRMLYCETCIEEDLQA